MANLSFTKKDNIYVATLPNTVGLLHVKMRDAGKLTVYASLDGMDPVLVPFDQRKMYLSGSNILCKISLSGVSKIIVVATKEVVEAKYNTVTP